MALFQFRWLRRFVRRYTTPIEEDTAALWKRRLSLAYMLVAWNAFGFVAYMIYTGKADWAKAYGLKTESELKMSPAQQWARTLGIKNATVYKVDGLKVSKYEVHNDDLDQENQTEVKQTDDELETN